LPPSALKSISEGFTPDHAFVTRIGRAAGAAVVVACVSALVVLATDAVVAAELVDVEALTVTVFVELDPHPEIPTASAASPNAILRTRGTIPD